MKKVLFIAAALIVCTSFSFAADLESESFDVYSLSPLTASALDYAVTPLSATSWDTSDSKNLTDIRNALCYSGTIGTPTILGLLERIDSNVGSFYFDSDSASELTNINGKINLMNVTLNAINDVLQTELDYLPNLVSLQSMEYNLDYIEENVSSLLPLVSDLRAFLYNPLSFDIGYLDANGQYVNSATLGPGDWAFWSSLSAVSSTFDGALSLTSDRTLYSRVKQLQETLASDDDKALAESQKQNREEIEDSFLNGSSGSTSLGASDFGDLSDVGGTVNDTLSLNGQASVSSFTSGLSGADAEGQNWFSAATRDSLDSVSGGISTFALDDPYNMEGWEDQYSWVLGGE